MQDDRSPGSVAADEAQMDAAVLALLLDPDAQRPLSDAEVCREAGDDLHARDALDRLHAAGLVQVRCAHGAPRRPREPAEAVVDDRATGRGD